MYINKVISYLGGWDKLRFNHSKVYDDIESVVEQFTTENLTNPEVVKPPYRSSSSDRKIVIEPMNFIYGFDNLLADKGWDSFRLRPSEKGGLHLYARNLKDSVSARLMFSNRMQQFPTWIFVETSRLYAAAVTELSVLLVPDEDVAQLLEGRRNIPQLTIESCLAQLEDLSPLRNEAPFVVLGYSCQPNLLPLEIIEVESEYSVGSNNIIEKCIEFAPEHYQAGIGILSYFGEVLKAKHPESKAKVKIEQDGNFVRLYIESKNGDKEIIEKTLEEYTLVVAEEAKPETLFSNDMEVMALNHKLEMAKMEVRQMQNMLMLSEKMHGQRVCTLEQEVSYMRTQLANQLKNSTDDKKLIGNFTLQQGEVIDAQMIQNEKLIDALIDQACYQSEIVDALGKIKHKLEAGVEENDKDELMHEMSIVANQAPQLMPMLGEAIKSTIYGVTGNIAYQWFLKMGTLVP